MDCLLSLILLLICLLRFDMQEIKQAAACLCLVIFKVDSGYRVSNLDGVFSMERLMEVFK